MSFESKVIRAAEERLAVRRQQQEQEYAQRRDVVYRRIPRIRTIDRQLRATVTLAATTALKKGEDPTTAIAAIRDANLSLQQERSQLLKQHGWSEDYLTSKPVCPICSDRGWVKSTMCSCLKALCTQEQNKLLSSLLDLKGQSFDTFRMDYYGVPYTQDRMGMERIFTVCRNYATQFSTFATRNLLFFGTPGVGKTFLSASIARCVSDQGYSVVYDTAANIFYQFEMEKFARDPEAQQSTRRYLNADLLILDDLGSEMTTPFVQSALYRLVNERLVRNKSTIISTNLYPDKLAGRYSEQIYSRLMGDYQPLEFRGPDIRQLKRR